MENPLYDTWRELYQDARFDYGMWMWPDGVEERCRQLLNHHRIMHQLQQKYAWAIPSPEAISRLAELGPMVEIGAGRGYWAALINDAGGDVICYDAFPPTEPGNFWAPPVGQHQHFDVEVLIEKAQFTEVQQGGPQVAALHPHRALFLCWPVYEDLMALECLAHYKGDTVVYVGEPKGGCTGCDAFHDQLETEFEEVECIDIPFWDGLHDALWIFKRS